MINTIKFAERDRLYGSLIDELELKKIDEKYYPESFGDFIIVFSSKFFFLRYTKDRSELAIEIAANSRPSEWYNMIFVKNYIEKAEELNPEIEDYGSFQSILEQNDFIKNKKFELSNLFNEANYKHTFAAIDQRLKEEASKKFPGMV